MATPRLPRLPSTVTWRLPRWLVGEVAKVGSLGSSLEARMAFAVRLATRNVERGTGGPFAALVVDEASGRLLAAGVNLVSASHASTAHAEMVALSLAEQRLGNDDLSEGGRVRRQLVTTAEPCAMCLGAIPWSGVSSLVVAARDGDVRAIGFDEGDKPSAWAKRLRARGITVSTDVLRAAACGVLERYRSTGGPTYGPRASTAPSRRGGPPSPRR